MRVVGARLAPLTAMLALLLLVTACVSNVPQHRRPVQVLGGPQAPAPAVIAPVAVPTPPPLAAGPIRVALLVPLSGQAASVGQAMLNAAQLALFETGADAVELLPRDTAAPGGAAGAAQEVLGQGAQLILGPLFSQDVRPVASVAASRGVNVIAFTTDATVAGGNALVMGFIPAEQVDRVVGYAAGRGLRRIAVVAPANPYGQAVTAAMRSAAGRYGVTVVNAVQYDPAGGDLSAVVQNAASLGGADAVMLADAGPALRGVVPALRAGGFPQAQLLGTGLWDEPNIGQEQALQGAWYASPPPNLRAGFEQRYASLYGQRPPRLATLAYDAMSLATRLAQIRGPQAFDRSILLDPAGFTGVDGVFRFNPTGVVQRGMAVLEVQPQGPVLIDPAPNSFTGPAF